MWKCKVFNSPSRLLDFLNENNIKPENCKITECGDYYTVFYYVEND
jgi:hypothetical protein